MKKKIAVYGGSFNPPGLHHVKIVKKLARSFDGVFVVLCGARPDKKTVNLIEPIHRANMASLAFRGIDRKVKLDISDIENGVFTRNHELEERYASRGEVWHVVGTDIVRGGARGRSQIHRVWKRGKELWDNLNFLVLSRDGYVLDDRDLPPHSRVMRGTEGSSSEIRKMAKKGENIGALTPFSVASYIRKNKLYR